MVSKPSQAIVESHQVKHFVTKDGLRVHLIKKPFYHQTVASLATRFGALQRHFVNQKGELETIPAGTAHFLEHKLFDKQAGDVLLDFAAFGADANAFTSNDVTCYYFSTNQEVKKNLTILLKFVQEPFFTEKTVARERGIIEEEIAGYEDDPFSALYQGLMATAFPDTALASDIAGTPESLKTISAELLYRVHEAFYQPSNLTLTIVGDQDFDELTKWVQEAQDKVATRSGMKQDQNVSLKLPTDRNRTAVQDFSVAQDKLALLKRLPVLPELNKVTQRLLGEIALDLVFGEQSDWYQKHYQQGDLGDDFDYELVVMEKDAYVVFFTSGKRVQEQGDLIAKRLTVLPDRLADFKREWTLLQRALIGENSQQQDRLEQWALDEDLILCDLSLFDKMKLLAGFAPDAVNKYVQAAFKPGPLTQFMLRSRDNGRKFNK
ncbi:insulinase family protein [Fructobacillus sp. M1-13]|uniref:Insulinase family protein n=1 Tax=Fructobacillus papyriferae TaxID=2713171 RepID=A0ABS5QNL1_9LACO|nr:pitrilysin family protein [Fructobacillus papyriferae]MBS9334432.1 insulinase family protein [Fructobacillus papyriferae]MCD2158421.1 insulinase family protein [Fructobacillus papyriferae]